MCCPAGTLVAAGLTQSWHGAFPAVRIVVMRDRAPAKHLPRLGVAIAMVVGLLLQLVLLPAGAFAEPVDPLWALGGICHGAAG